MLKKCVKCPYRRKQVKCVTSPCPACKASGSEKNPFSSMNNSQEISTELKGKNVK